MRSRYGEKLYSLIQRLGLRCASLWPVFTETLYFMYRDLGKRIDFDKLLEDIKKCLSGVTEVELRFHEVLDDLKPDLDLADTSLLKVLKNPLMILLSEDSRLVMKARGLGMTAFTPWEILSFTT